MLGRHIYLVRHAKSSWEESPLADFDRPLSKRGIKSLPTLAHLMRVFEPPPELILTSPAKRTQQTTKGIGENLPKSIAISLEPELYHASAEMICRILQQLPNELQAVMLVGHNPGLEDFLGWICGCPKGISSMRMPTGCVAWLRISGEQSWSEMAEGAGILQALLPVRLLTKLLD